MRKPVAFLGLSALLMSALLAASCARTEPRMPYGDIGLVYYGGEGGGERYTFFVMAEDDDGPDNLADLYLFHDREQLRWHIPADEWITYESEDRTWIGTRALVAPEGETLPRGRFRAVLENKGGERAERIITFDAPENPRFPFPALKFSDGEFAAVSSYPSNSLALYDEQGRFLRAIPLTELSGSVSDLPLPGNARLAALWAEDPDRLTSAFTDVIPIVR
ncbi:MAG: hypothetical protein FWD94_06390 [Treponema sp.]|nr:hypothetical protein [Treponema sp.]